MVAALLLVLGQLPWIEDPDPANQNGGKWIIRFKKAVSGRFWEDLVSGPVPLYVCVLRRLFDGRVDHILVKLQYTFYGLCVVKYPLPEPRIKDYT